MSLADPEPKAIAELVEDEREMIELVASGDDESARMAQNLLDEVDNA